MIISLLFVLVKAEEVMFLWKRFQQLGPNKDGHVHRSVFANNPIYSGGFCRQVMDISQSIAFLFSAVFTM